MNSTLTEKLSYVSGFRDERTRVAHYVLEHPAEFSNLLKLCFSAEKEISHKACWVTELVCKSNLEILFPQLNYFLDNIPTLTNDSAIRPMAKVCELLCESYFVKQDKNALNIITTNNLEKLTEVCFDWLIADVKVATKAYSMQNLFLLGKKIDWIYPELKPILMRGISEHTAAYKARARHILEKI
ncbi:hypothetical protein [Joostella sp. CR20]|uniref:hypothetical protein n=1 Tax=Joostella sp. CR20 TaxID=2804312 RepID=UPI00313C190D